LRLAIASLLRITWLRRIAAILRRSPLTSSIPYRRISKVVGGRARKDSHTRVSLSIWIRFLKMNVSLRLWKILKSSR
jgi:hypothetical protein